jgi:hypothetical protein
MLDMSEFWWENGLFGGILSILAKTGKSNFCFPLLPLSALYWYIIA